MLELQPCLDSLDGGAGFRTMSGFAGWTMEFGMALALGHWVRAAKGEMFGSKNEKNLAVAMPTRKFVGDPKGFEIS